MKTLFKVFFFLTAFFFSIESIEATTITWLGGSGPWDNASRWDTGVVPGLGDDVIIPSGWVRIYNGDSEQATSVEVQAAGKLIIYNGGELEIQGAVDNDGLHNIGRVYVFGVLAINSITQTSPAFSAHAINNEGRIYTYINSQINIKYIDDIAINNASAFSYFRLSGGLWIFSVENAAIYNADRFYNYGNIDIEESGEPSGFLIVNSDTFRNYSSGVITISSDIYGGITNNGSGNTFSNYGEINVDETSVGINNSGDFYNYDGASIEIENGAIGYFNRSDGNLTNEGYSAVRHSYSGIYNYGNFTNRDHFSVWYSGNNGGVRNFPGGTIDNYYDIYLNATGARDVENDGNFTNHPGSILEVNKIIDVGTTGVLLNYGFLVSHSTANHIIDGYLGNKGAIDDNYGTLQSYIDNLEIVVAPVAGPMYEGVPYADVLDIHSLDDFTIGNWKISPNGAIAGTYNSATNEFTPNSAAVGISTLYIVIENITSGFSRNFSLEIDGGILPLVEEDTPAFFQNDQNDNFLLEEKSVTVFPNPTTGSIQLQSKNFEKNQTEIFIYNTLGQLVQQVQFEMGGLTKNIEMSSHLGNGMYILKMIQKNKELSVQKIELER